MPGQFFTTEEVAKKLGVNKRTVQRWIEDGIIAFVKVGKVVRIREEHLESWLDKKTIKAQKKIA